MPKNKKKVAPLVVVGLLGLGAYAYAKSQEPTAGFGADISIGVLDSLGNPTTTVVGGGTYTVEATVTNKSTRGGIAIPATFVLVFGGTLDGTGLGFTPYDISVAFLANQPLVIRSVFTTPAGVEAMTGKVTVQVLAPTGVVIASAEELLNISIVAPVYAADLTIRIV